MNSLDVLVIQCVKKQIQKIQGMMTETYLNSTT